MSERRQQEESRAERIARYKEERRKELASKHGGNNSELVTRKTKDGSSSSDRGPRTTKASRLRTQAQAATAQENASSPTQAPKLNYLEKSPEDSVRGYESRLHGNRRVVERDKSSKRKSNLNRALNSEEVPLVDFDDIKNSRRRRRVPPQTLEQSIKELSLSNDRLKTNSNLTASQLSSSSASNCTALSTAAKSTNRKTDLSIHMENARKGITPSYSEIGKFKYTASKPLLNSKDAPSKYLSNSVKDRNLSFSDKEPNDYSLDACKENLKTNNMETDRRLVFNKFKPNSDNDDLVTHKLVSKKMEELTALTKETLIRVEKLANKSKESPKKDIFDKKPLSNSSIKPVDSKLPTKISSFRSDRSDRLMRSSVLKKKSFEEPELDQPVVSHSINTTPVSILKRKVSQDDQTRHEGSVTNTPPVTFSPNVVEPTTTNRKQGILKKRRSLDESQVMRHRSCSPDVANKSPDSKSILKGKRRSSLEELTRIESPEMHLHSILKRKTSRSEDEDFFFNSPQSILKRKSGASSAGSTGSTPHVSITTAVILAAAGGAEMVLEPQQESYKPILKKKSFSEDHSYMDHYSDTPKPILKKKSSTDTDDCDDMPKKPILKFPRGSLDRELYDTSSDLRSKTNLSENDCDVKPILKLGTSREESPRPRLSFCSDNISVDAVGTARNKRRSHTICADFKFNTCGDVEKNDDRTLRKPRPLSVFELVMNFEKSVVGSATGAVPKRSSLKRNCDRYRTQPVTSEELEESLNFVRSPPQVQGQNNSSPIPNSNYTAEQRNFSLEYVSSIENDSQLNSYFSTSLNHTTTTSPDSGVCGKMSSDSAFQSLGDGLELEQDDDTGVSKNIDCPQKMLPGKLEQVKLEMKAIADAAKKMKLGKVNAGIQKHKNRKSSGSTQPVTLEEVQEASKLGTNMDKVDEDDSDPCNLSLSERIQLFSLSSQQKCSTAKRLVATRFKTQPVTIDEVENARSITPLHADDSKIEQRSEKRGILKSTILSEHEISKSDMKKPDIKLGSPEDRRPIIKTDVPDSTYDEGISCNDSASDSENASPSVPSSAVYVAPSRETNKNYAYKGVNRSATISAGDRKKSKSSSDTTSDGDSSGGREIRSIFKTENQLRVKQALETVLSKSKSQSTVGHENADEGTSQRKNTSIRRSHTQSAMPRSIAELQAKLQQRGESEWKKRVSDNNNATDELLLLKEKNRYNDELSEKSILATKKDELDAAADQWKSRVDKSDAEKYSIAGRMDFRKGEEKLPALNISPTFNSKKTPQAKRYKGREGNDARSTPVSPEKSSRLDFKRSQSEPNNAKDADSLESDSSMNAIGRKVAVLKPDDDTFTSFYKTTNSTTDQSKTDYLEVSLEDFDKVCRQSNSLLIQKKNVQVQKRRVASKNPIKALASRTDITNEYIEVTTGVAEREQKRLNIEKLAKNSNLAIEALAGLASKEDFTTVALKKSTGPTAYLPYKERMLLQVKGRRHIQTRLVDPNPDSINEGDNYILVTPTALYTYNGEYSNVIEHSRAADVVNHIQKTNDLGCKATRIVNINRKNYNVVSKDHRQFWKLLGANDSVQCTGAGHPDEDEIFESNILATNMIYGIEDNELVPLQGYWGAIPKIEMLKSDAVIVFDFGSEMYVWSGKNAQQSEKKLALKLAQELWKEGYNYSECNICPLNVASVLGNRKKEAPSLKSNKRPEWSLFAKLTQHRETILFKEKFLDWPDYSRIIRIKDAESIKSTDASYNFKSCNVKDILNKVDNGPDLEVEGTHLGRGDTYFDEETRRQFDFDTLEIKCWRILEHTFEKLPEESIGHFFDCDTYILRWRFRMTVKGRDLTGIPSKHAQSGRDRCVYFYWQGSHASINDKGLAALLTVELDSENAPQIRIAQGAEPAAFLKLFNGKMIVHNGKRDSANNYTNRLFIVRGEIENETHLLEVPCNTSQLRSRTCLVFINTDEEEITVWYGSKSSNQTRKTAKLAVDYIAENKFIEFNLAGIGEISVKDVEEGEEDEEFLKHLESDKYSYLSLRDSKENFEYTIKLFHLTGISGEFEANEILCPHRSDFTSPYPFLQNDLYSASQPALFLIDNNYELWLWQGWWPDREEEEEAELDLSDQTGSGAIRLHAERKAAMQTAINYWREKHPDGEAVSAYLTWAGLEPLEFKNLFPIWKEREDVKELNIKVGKKVGEKRHLEKELAFISRTTYPLAELLQRPLPDGVDPTHIEMYLSSEDFEKLLSMSKEEFKKLPSWKKKALKKDKGLF